MLDSINFYVINNTFVKILWSKTDSFINIYATAKFYTCTKFTVEKLSFNGAQKFLYFETCFLLEKIVSEKYVKEPSNINTCCVHLSLAV